MRITEYRFECQGSGKCCVSRGDYGNVYFTLSDRRRAAQHFGITTREFTRMHCEKKFGYWRLKEGQDPECRFLEKKRCTIYEARPTQCRTWPFWSENLNPKAWTELARFCPGVGKGRVWSVSEIEKIAKEQARSDKSL